MSQDEADDFPPMVLSPDLQYPSKSRVMIQGLLHKKALNGHLAVVESFLLDQGRYKVRPLSRKARLLTKSHTLAVQPSNLQIVSPSAFLAHITTSTDPNNRIQVPLECRVEMDEWQIQLVVKVLISNFGGSETQQKLRAELLLSTNTTMHPPGLEKEEDKESAAVIDDDESYVLAIINTPIDYEELQVSMVHNPVQQLKGDEIFIIPKNIFAEIYDAMIDYELVEELDTMIPAGLHGELPLCRLRFQFDF